MLLGGFVGGVQRTGAATKAPGRLEAQMTGELHRQALARKHGGLRAAIAARPRSGLVPTNATFGLPTAHRRLFETLDDERDHYDAVADASDAGIAWVRNDQCVSSSCDQHMECWKRPWQDEGWCAAETVGCRDCADAPGDVCYDAPQCKDRLYHCDALTDEDLWVIEAEARRLHFEEIGVQHPCLARECVGNRDSSECQGVVWGYCCDPALADCPLSARTACTAGGCSSYQSEWWDHFDGGDFDCPFADAALCDSGACPRWDWQVYDGFVTGTRCHDTREGHCILDTMDSFCEDPDRAYPVSEDRTAVMRWEAEHLNWTTSWSPSEQVIVGTAPDGVDMICVPSANRCANRSCEFIAWAWDALLAGDDIITGNFSWTAADYNSSALLKCTWETDPHLLQECFSELTGPCFPDPDASFLPVPFETNHYACARDLAAWCKAHPADPGCAPPCPFTCGDIGDACPCVADTCTVLMATSECTRAACDPFKSALTHAHLARGALQPTDAWMRNAIRYHIRAEEGDVPDPTDPLTWTPDMIASEPACPIAGALMDCTATMIAYCNTPNGWWESGCRDLLSTASNGAFEWGEECDDGNRAWFDGCHGSTYKNPGHECPREGQPCFECWHDDKLENKWDQQTTNTFPFCINSLVGDPDVVPPAGLAACFNIETLPGAAECRDGVEAYRVALNASEAYDPGFDEWTDPTEAFSIPRVADNCTYSVKCVKFFGRNIEEKCYAIIECAFESEGRVWNDTTPRVEWTGRVAGGQYSEGDLEANVTELITRLDRDRGVDPGALLRLDEIELTDVSPYADARIASKHGQPLNWEGTQPLAWLTHEALLAEYDADDLSALRSLQGDVNRGCQQFFGEDYWGPDHPGEPLRTVPPCVDPVHMVVHADILETVWHREHGQWTDDDYSAFDPWASPPVCERAPGKFVAYLPLSTTYRSGSDGRLHSEPRWLPPIPLAEVGARENVTLSDAIGTSILKSLDFNVADDPAAAARAYDATGIPVAGRWLPPTTFEEALRAGSMRVHFGRRMWAEGCASRDCDALIEHCRVAGVVPRTPAPDARAFVASATRLEPAFDATGTATTAAEIVARSTAVGIEGASYAITDVEALVAAVTITDSVPAYLRDVENWCPHAPWHANGTFNGAWGADPCCNWEKRRYECCAPRDVPHGTLLSVVDINKDAIATQCEHPSTVEYMLRAVIRDVAAAEECAEELAAASSHDVWDDFWKYRSRCDKLMSETTDGDPCTSDDDCYCSAAVCTDYGGGGAKHCSIPYAARSTCYAECFATEMDPIIARHLRVGWGLSASAPLAELVAAFLVHATEPACVGPTAWRAGAPHDEWHCDAACEDAHTCDSWQYGEKLRRAATPVGGNVPWIDYNQNAEACAGVGGEQRCQHWEYDAFGAQTSICGWAECSWSGAELPCTAQNTCWDDCHAACSQPVACMRDRGAWYAPRGSSLEDHVYTIANASLAESVAATDALGIFEDPFRALGGGVCCPTGSHVRVNIWRSGSDAEMVVERSLECAPGRPGTPRGHEERTRTCCTAAGGEWHATQYGGECCMGTWREQWNARDRRMDSWCEENSRMDCWSGDCGCANAGNACQECHEARQGCCAERFVPANRGICETDAYCNNARTLQNAMSPSGGGGLSPWSDTAEQAAVCTENDVGFCVERTHDWSWPQTEAPRCSLEIYEHELEWWQTQSTACAAGGGTWRENEWPQCVREGVHDTDTCWGGDAGLCPDRFSGLWLPEGLPVPAYPWHHVSCDRGCYAPDVDEVSCRRGRGDWQDLDWVSPSNGDACNWGAGYTTGECPGQRLRGCFREWTFEGECLNSTGGAWLPIPGHPDHGLCAYPSMNVSECAVLHHRRWVDGCYSWDTSEWACAAGWGGAWNDARWDMGVTAGAEPVPACALNNIPSYDGCLAVGGFPTWGCFANPALIDEGACAAAKGTWWLGDPSAPLGLNASRPTCNWPRMSHDECFALGSLSAYEPHTSWSCWEWAIGNETACVEPSPGVYEDVEAITAPFGGACNLWEGDPQRCRERDGDPWFGCYRWDINETACVAGGHTWQESSTPDNDWASCKLAIADTDNCWDQPGETRSMWGCYSWAVGSAGSCTDAPNGWWDEAYGNGTGMCRLHRWDAASCAEAPVNTTWVATRRGYQNGRFADETECGEGLCQGSIMWRAWHGWSQEQCEANSDWECDRNCPRCVTWQWPFANTGFGGCFTNETIGSCPDWGCCDPPCVITRFPDTGEAPTESTCRSADHTDIPGALHWVTCDDMPEGACPNPNAWGPNDPLGAPADGGAAAAAWEYQPALQCRRSWHRCRTREECESAGECNDHHNARTECTLGADAWPPGPHVMSMAVPRVVGVAGGTNYTIMDTHVCPWTARVQLDGICVSPPGAADGWACSPGTWHPYGCVRPAGNYSSCTALGARWWRQAVTAAECRNTTGCSEPFRSDILPKTEEECGRCRGTVVPLNSWNGGYWKPPGKRALTWMDGQRMLPTNDWGTTISERKLQPWLMAAAMRAFAEVLESRLRMQFAAKSRAYLYVAADCAGGALPQELLDEYRAMAFEGVKVGSTTAFCDIEVAAEGACRTMRVSKICTNETQTGRRLTGSSGGGSSSASSAAEDSTAAVVAYLMPAAGVSAPLEPCGGDALDTVVLDHTGIAVGQLGGNGLAFVSSSGFRNKVCFTLEAAIRRWPELYSVPDIIVHEAGGAWRALGVNASSWVQGVTFCYEVTAPGSYFPAWVPSNASAADCATPCVAGHGICPVGNGSCMCFCGFSGPGCAEGCPHGCSDSGTCGANNTCACDAPFVGDACDRVNCSSVAGAAQCSGHGTCARSGLCECVVGWSGDACGQRLFTVRVEATSAGFSTIALSRAHGVFRWDLHFGTPPWWLIAAALALGFIVACVLAGCCCAGCTRAYNRTRWGHALLRPLACCLDRKTGCCVRRMPRVRACCTGAWAIWLLYRVTCCGCCSGCACCRREPSKGEGEQEQARRLLTVMTSDAPPRGSLPMTRMAPPKVDKRTRAAIDALV